MTKKTWGWKHAAAALAVAWWLGWLPSLEDMPKLPKLSPPSNDGALPAMLDAFAWNLLYEAGGITRDEVAAKLDEMFKRGTLGQSVGAAYPDDVERIVDAVRVACGADNDMSDAERQAVAQALRREARALR